MTAIYKFCLHQLLLTLSQALYECFSYHLQFVLLFNTLDSGGPICSVRELDPFTLILHQLGGMERE